MADMSGDEMAALLDEWMGDTMAIYWVAKSGTALVELMEHSMVVLSVGVLVDAVGVVKTVLQRTAS